MTNAAIDASRFFPFTPDAAQLRAVELAAEHKCLIITGGPGVGKTATTNAVLNYFDELGLHTICCAPTGKAAIRMAEQTGREAGTIHRTLGFAPADSENDSPWKFNAANPLDCGALVVDEASMIDSELFAALIEALPTTARLVIVGDVDQLPSIGAGRVLYDLIESGEVPTVRLTKIFRQAEESRIPYIARDINTGNCPDTTSLDKDGDVVFAPVLDENSVAHAVVSAFKTHLPNRGYTQDDIQVLCPQKNKACGVEELNFLLQRELNPNAYDSRRGIKIGNSYTAHEGDRVIHTRNNYKLMTFNGEIGKVIACNWKGLQSIGDAKHNGSFAEGGETAPRGPFVCVVQYDDRKVAYTKEESWDLQLAYAITIHKSQGSQFKAVVMPVHTCHSFMLTRPLVYTGITRAAEMLLMVGETEALAAASTNTRGVQRRTTLQAATKAAAAGEAA